MTTKESILSEKTLKPNSKVNQPSEPYKRVIFIGVDGIGNFAAPPANCPNIQNFLSTSAHTYNGRAESPTISAQNWGSMFHGVTPNKHGLTNELIENGKAYPEDDKYPSILKILNNNKSNKEFTSASIVSWSPINTGILELSLKTQRFSFPNDEPWYTRFWRKIQSTIFAKYTEDNPVFEKSIEFLQSKNYVDFLFIYFGTVDSMGHRKNYQGEQYYQQLELIDGYVGGVLEAIKEFGWDEDALILLTTDHGGIKNNHGGDSEEELNIIWGARGEGIESGKILKEVSNMSIAAVILTAFGKKIPDYFDSKVPDGLWN
ncbi:2593_t:CDS:1 [Entrophospora sp. SA101]|nr:7893_t:CDS:1 [Entrophospora sp. SA101]CAJ0633278.1 5072_t:CDS:1 [Entrophospora sp. SA101]CAJ0759953.1 2593_t:CDS:1 [Entrophospora sp. SA101]CAJ0836886.1 9657_t:CDS:1 [Entrophospora sp. SA101]CAJ0842917.1 5765_t:CDS:1 [Entrophospora sp. SA101]